MTQRRETPEAQQIYADSGLPWREVARRLEADLADKIRRITELEAASASVIAEQSHPLAGIREALQQIVDDAVGAPTDPLVIVQRDMILAGIVALQNDEDAATMGTAGASVIAEMPHNIATCACMSCSMARSSMQIQIEASVIAEMPVNLRRMDTPENRAFWESVEKAKLLWEETKPSWVRELEQRQADVGSNNSFKEMEQQIDKLRVLGRDCQRNPITVPNLAEQLWDCADTLSGLLSRLQGATK